MTHRSMDSSSVKSGRYFSGGTNENMEANHDKIKFESVNNEALPMELNPIKASEIRQRCLRLQACAPSKNIVTMENNQPMIHKT